MVALSRVEFVFEYLGFVVDVVTAGFAVQQRVRNAERTGSGPAPLPSRAAKFRHQPHR